MGGNDTDTTTSTSSLGNSALNGAVTTIGNQLNTQLQQGVNPYPLNSYAGQSNQTVTGAQNLWNASQNTGGLNMANNFAQGNIAMGGYNPALANALASTTAAGSGYASMAGPSGPSLTEQQLMGVAKGGAFGTKDPGYASLRSGIINDVTEATNGAFNASGRFGGGSNVESLSQGLGDSLGALDYQNYQSDIGRQERALSAIEGQRQTGTNNRFQALAGQTGAASQAAGIGQTAMGNAASSAAALPGLYQAGMTPAITQLQVGALLDDDAQKRRQGEIDLWNNKYNGGWNTLARGSQILNGTASAGGQTQSTTSPATPWWQQILGAGAIGSGIYKNIWGA